MARAAMLREIRRLTADLLARRARPADDPAADPWFDPGCPCGVEPGTCREHPRARPAQRMPDDPDCLIYARICGRGSGKTLSAAKIVHRRAATRPGELIGICGRTSSNSRDIMVRGESGLLRTAPPGFRPRYLPTQRRIVWPNGAEAMVLSADQPDTLAGFNFGFLWTDELFLWDRPREAFDTLTLANRRGQPQTIITSTPRGSPFLEDLLRRPTTRLSKETTFDNSANLPASWLENAKAIFGTGRYGLQELYATISDTAEHVVMSCFGDHNVSGSAGWYPGLPVRIAVDCGSSGHTFALWYQIRSGPPERITVLAELHYDHKAEKAYHAAAAAAIRDHTLKVCQGQYHRVILDPYGANQEGGNGPAAMGAYRQVFGERFVGTWPGHGVMDGIDTTNLLLDAGRIAIHPACVKTIKALKTHAWEVRRGEPTNVPSDEHPHADACDTLRGIVWDKFPGTLKPADAGLITTHASRSI